MAKKVHNGTFTFVVFAVFGLANDELVKMETAEGRASFKREADVCSLYKFSGL